MAQKQRILIIKFGALGDVLLSEGHVRAIVARHRDDVITILTEPAMVSLFRQMTYALKKRNIDFLAVKRKHYWQLPWLLFQLWKKDFHKVYDLQTSSYSERLYRLLPKKPLWNGRVKNIWQDQNIHRNRLHGVDRINQQLHYAGITNIKPPRVDYLQGRRFSFFHEPFFLLVIGGSRAKVRNGQVLPLKSFIALAQWLEKKNIRSVLVGGKLEEKSAAALSAAVPSTINLVGKTTLGDVASLARHTRGCVGNDTALTHLIALAQIKNRHHQPPLKPKAKGKRTAKTMARRGGRFDLKKSPPIITIITPPGRTVWGRPLSADGQTHDHAASNVRVVYKNKASNITLTDITKALQKI